VGAFAPAANADHGRGNANGHYKNRGDEGGYVRAGYPVRQVYIQRHSDSVGPALIGFIGGLIVGSAIHSHPVYASAPPPECDYYDSYCDERFSSMSAYENHLRYHHHPRVVLVVNVRSGECVGERDWRDGRWYQGDYSRDGNRRYVSRYDDRGYGQAQVDEGNRGGYEDNQGDDRHADRAYGR
jgi:hypothetical protein